MGNILNHVVTEFNMIGIWVFEMYFCVMEFLLKCYKTF